MRMTKRPLLLTVLALSLFWSALACQADTDTETYYYGIEINDVLCGYAELTASPAEIDGRETTLLKHRVFLMVSALGSRFNSDVRLTYHIDPTTGQFTYHDSQIDQGATHLESEIRIEGNTAHCSSSMSDEITTVELGPDVVLESTLHLRHLVKDFVEGGIEEKTYKIFEVREFEVQESTYTLAGTETLDLAGRTFDAVILDRLSLATGLKLTMWIDRDTGMVLKVVHPNNRLGYLADASVRKKIEVANIDQTFTASTNVAIPDIKAITYMKVRATVEPTGLWVTPESLNVPGQSFEGTVENNRVEGVFEISHPRYDGANAPPFPPDFEGDETLREYLEPKDFIESKDPVLVAKAEEITAGSKNSWEAAVRLSRWVAENIDYEIPGGSTARRTYDIRAGECGSHSILFAAFSRAVGIPARVVWGCMYIPNFGGAFGQHGWNEVYMGEAGWITIDTTAMETDFVDSGHIRIGELQSMSTALNPVEMEVLDHRVGSGETADAGSDAEERYAAYLGEFKHEAGIAAEVVVQDGSLVVNIPGRVMLALSDADDQGRWYAKASNRVYCTFDTDGDGEVTAVLIHEIARMRRTGDPEGVDETVPESFRPFLGDYLLGPLNATFTVLYRDGNLAVNDPLAKKVVGLQEPDDAGRFLDEFGKHSISFEQGEDGKVTALLLDAANRFGR